MAHRVSIVETHIGMRTHYVAWTGWKMKATIAKCQSFVANILNFPKNEPLNSHETHKGDTKSNVVMSIWFSELNPNTQPTTTVHSTHSPSLPCHMSTSITVRSFMVDSFDWPALVSGFYLFVYFFLHDLKSRFNSAACVHMLPFDTTLSCPAIVLLQVTTIVTTI